MEIYGLNIYNNFIFNNEDPTKIMNEDILSNKSYDEETIPDEDFNKNKKKREKLNSCPNVEQKGPNINLKIARKRYRNQKEKEFFFAKIKRKKKNRIM